MKGVYVKSNNYEIIDTIGVPHPFMITHHHVGIASDKFSGRLGDEAIEEAYKQGHRCGMKGCRLTYKEHEQALLVACKADPSIGSNGDELQKMLEHNVEECEANGYAGFTMLKQF